jgi:hypothetical protein
LQDKPLMQKDLGEYPIYSISVGKIGATSINLLGNEGQRLASTCVE